MLVLSLRAFFQRYGLEVKQGFNDEISAATLVSSDRNVAAIILETLDDLSLENLVTIPIEELQEPFHIIYLGYNKKSFHSHLVEEFIKFTQKAHQVSCRCSSAGRVLHQR